MPVDLRPNEAAAEGRIPSNTQAEEQLLSALMLQPTETVPKVTGTIEPSDFYDRAHGRIYAAMLELVEEGVKPDPIVVVDKLREWGDLDRIGGARRVIDIHGAMSGYASNAERYVSIITNAARRRDLLAVAERIRELAYDEHESALGAAQALEAVQAVVDATNKRVKLRTMAEMLDDYTEVLESRERGEGLGIMTGFRDLDEITQGMRPGQLWVCGAPPKTGKSTWAASLAKNVVKEGHGTLLVSVEMAETEVMERIMANEARVDVQRLRMGDLDIERWQRIGLAASRLSEVPLWILDDTNATLAEVRACALRTGVELVIIDYTQLMKAEVRRGGTREQVVAELTAGMKRLARELGIAVVALSQVKRDAADQRPGLTDFAESSSFEKNADYLLGLYRDNESPSERGTIEVIVIASRHTKTGVAKLAYLGHYQSIANMAQVEQRPEGQNVYDGWRDRSPG